MATDYQERVIQDIRDDEKRRKNAYLERFGERFLDVILVSPNGHGAGNPSYHCEFKGRSSSRTYGLAEFAQWVFGKGGGVLKKIEPLPHWNGRGERWVVLSK